MNKMITSIGYREGSEAEREKDTELLNSYDDDFKFTELKKSSDKEILDLKNDVLKLCDNLDLLTQSVTNLNHKVETKLEYQMKFIEKVKHSVNEIFIILEDITD